MLLSVTGSKRWSVALLVLMFLPGTIVHELSHMLVAGIFFVPVGKIDVVPELTKDGRVRYGRAQIGKTDIFRRSLIGLSPLLAGLATLWIIYFLLLSPLPTSFSEILIFMQQPIVWLGLYLTFFISTMMFSSRKDLEVLLVSVPVLTILIALSLQAFIFSLTFLLVQRP